MQLENMIVHCIEIERFGGNEGEQSVCQAEGMEMTVQGS